MPSGNVRGRREEQLVEQLMFQWFQRQNASLLSCGARRAQVVGALLMGSPGPSAEDGIQKGFASRKAEGCWWLHAVWTNFRWRFGGIMRKKVFFSSCEELQSAFRWAVLGLILMFFFSEIPLAFLQKGLCQGIYACFLGL